MKPISTKYWYTVILLLEKPRKNSPIIDRSFHRESGHQFAKTAGSAATAIEKDYNQKDYIVDAITIRLLNEHGQVLLKTQKDDMTDKLPTSEGAYDSWPKSRLPHKIITGVAYSKPTDNDNRNFDIWKFLTVYVRPYENKPTLKCEEHL